MNKKTIFITTLFILLLFLVTNSISISVISSIIFLFLFIRQFKKEKDIDNSYLISNFFHSYYDEINQGHDVSISNLYDNFKSNIKNESLIPANQESDFDILENLKVYFDDAYFNAFYRIQVNDEVKDKKKMSICLMENYFNKEKNIIQQTIKKEKSNDKNLKILFICLLSIILIRFLFSKYFYIYSTSIVGICSLTIVSILAFITYKDYLFSLFERKSYEKN
ncbi:MAG: hypothetical protein ACI311_01635 [Bacilli bacterium]